jgi:hypothetical protein
MASLFSRFKMQSISSPLHYKNMTPQFGASL